MAGEPYAFDYILQYLCARLESSLAGLPIERKLSRSDELDLLGVISLCARHGRDLAGQSHVALITLRYGSFQGRGWFWLAPMRLALELVDDVRGQGIGDVSANLDHHNTSIREWIHEVAWIARDRLLLPDLITGFVSCLEHLYLSDAAGFLNYIAGHDDATVRQWLEHHEPDDSVRYARSLAHLRKHGALHKPPAHLHQVEAEVNTLLAELAASFRIVPRPIQLPFPARVIPPANLSQA